jgi:hypothetical protein
VAGISGDAPVHSTGLGKKNLKNMKDLIQRSTMLHLPRTLAAVSIIAFFAALAPPRAQAAATASDEACNDSPISSGANGGSGFAAWTGVATGGGGFYTAGAITGESGCSSSWGMFPSGSGTATAQRPFASSGTLSIGQTITVDMANGGIDSGGSEGMSLYNSSGTAVFEFYYQNGNGSWTIHDNSGTPLSGVPYEGEPSAVRVLFTLTSSTTYSLTVQAPIGTTSLSGHTGTLISESPQAISQLRFFTYNIGSGNNLEVGQIGVSCPTPTVTTQPSSTTVCSGSTASFTAASTTASSPTYQWQVNTGSGYANVSSGTGGTTGTYTTPTTTTSMNTYQYQCVVTDACGTSVYSSAATLTVNTSPSITTMSLPALTIGSPYSQTVSATGGSGYTWSISAGALPSTLTINPSSGLISGTYSGHAGTTNFTVEVMTSSGCSATQALSIVENCSSSIMLSPTSLPNGTVAASYGTQTLSGSGGTPSYTFAVTTGSLPAGLSLNTNTGAITGTPTSDTSQTFTVTVTDTNGCTGTQQYTVTPACPTVSLSPGGSNPQVLTAGTVGTSYSQTITGSGAENSFTFSKTSGTLPTGLALSSGGVLSGTPTASGTYTFTVTATDSSGCTGAQNYSLTMTCPTITVSPASLPIEVINAAYTNTITASGGTSPYTFAVGSGLPTGLNLSTGGVLSGIPTSTGVYSFTVTATDTHGCTGSAAYTVTVTNAAPTITTQPQPQTACNGSSATFTVGASGGASNSYAWYKHANAGWGSAWSATGSGTIFLGSATDNDNSEPDCNSFSGNGDINTPGGKSWGLYGGTTGESALRTFPAALTSGQVFQIDMDNGFVDTGLNVGFSLHNSGNTNLFSFFFTGGGSDYAYFDGTGTHTTSIGFMLTGLRIQVIVGTGSPASYVLLVTPCGGSTVEYTGTFATTGAPDEVLLYNNNTSGSGSVYNAYFNSLYVGSAYDNADNYAASGNWGGFDEGDTTPISGATNDSYSTTGNNGDLYYAIAYNAVGDAASTNALLTVNPLPTVSVNSATVCSNSSATLTATTSASSPSYLWSDSETTASITVSPSSTTIYTVTVTDGTTGCTNAGSGTVTVNPLPTVSVNSATACAGSPTILTATTSASSPSYLWSPGGATTASITVTPASTTTYTVTVTDGTTGCTNAGSGTVTVNPLPTVSVNSATVCAGSPATLTATTSASSPSYLWSPGGATTASFTVSPASTTAYTVTVTDGTTGCANSGSGTVTVNPLPTVSVNSATVCSNSPATLTATTSASSPSYLWSPGGATTASITVTPASTTTYTVTVTDGTTGCANNGPGTVTVNPLPVLTLDISNQTACVGSEVTWTVGATGSGLSYQWQRDGTNLVEGSDNFTGTTNATLTNSAVAAQDAQDTNDSPQGYVCVVSIGNCSVSSTLVSLTVNPLPTVSVNSATVCAGSPATLTATTSASSPSYLWSDSETTASITVSPSSTTTYTVTVTDGTTGCTNAGSGTVTVNPTPGAPMGGVTTNVAPTLDLIVNISNLLSSWSGSGLSLQSAGPTSTQGGTVTFDANYIYYIPPGGSISSDSIPYTVINGSGCTTTASIILTFVPQGGIAQSISLTNGNPTINFAGIPGFEYDIQRACNVNGPWTTLETTNAPSYGVFSYTDTNPPAGNAAYYRLLQH